MTNTEDIIRLIGMLPGNDHIDPTVEADKTYKNIRGIYYGLQDEIYE